MNLSIGKTIRKYREAKHLSLEDVSKRCAVSRNYLSVLENGDASPTISKLEEVCKGLGVSVVDFLGAHYHVQSIINKEVPSTLKNKDLELIKIFNEIPSKDKTTIFKMLSCFVNSKKK